MLSQLNETQEEYYTMPAEDAKDNASHRFPFSRRIYSDENDGTLNTVCVLRIQCAVIFI